MSLLVKNKKRIKIGGVNVSSNLIDRVVEVILKYDRMPENPDLDFLKFSIKSQLNKEGLLRLVVFVCPRYNPDALFTANPVKYIPTKITKNDLFEPRISKIADMRETLFKLGVVTTLEVVIGDNDFETYILPFVPNLVFDSEEMFDRKEMYIKSFQKRVKGEFGLLATVWSLSNLDVTLSGKKPKFSEEVYEREIRFFVWLFSDEGPYKGKLSFTESKLLEMVYLKFQAYGAQGDFLEQLGGVLLQTEGPGLWLQRTEMLRCTGAKSIPAIYPWIRREEMLEMRVERRSDASTP